MTPTNGLPYHYSEDDKFDELNISPSIEEIQKMNRYEIFQVHNFRVWNNHAEVEYLEPVDLRRADFGSIFRLTPRKIEVYPGDVYIPGFNKPEPGFGLNKSALLKYKHFFGKIFDDKAIEARLKNIKDECDRQGTIFVEFRKEEDMLIFKTYCF